MPYQVLYIVVCTCERTAPIPVRTTFLVLCTRYLHVFFIFKVYGKKCIFRSWYTISSIIVAWETRLTENGVPPEPNLLMVSLIYWVKAYIHPNLNVLPENRSKARIVVFASRKAIAEFW